MYANFSQSSMTDELGFKQRQLRWSRAAGQLRRKEASQWSHTKTVRERAFVSNLDEPDGRLRPH